MLTSTCWQKISLSNTVELTTVTPQKQNVCHFKRRFLPVFENSRPRDSIVTVCLHAVNPVTRLDWAVLFLRTSADCHTETGTYVKTKLPNHGTSRDLLRVGRQWNPWPGPGIFENRQKTFKAADLLLLWSDSSQFNGVWHRNLLSTCGCYC